MLINWGAGAFEQLLALYNPGKDKTHKIIFFLLISCFSLNSKLSQIVPNVLVLNLSHHLLDWRPRHLCLVHVELELELYPKLYKFLRLSVLGDHIQHQICENHIIFFLARQFFCNSLQFQNLIRYCQVLQYHLLKFLLDKSVLLLCLLALILQQHEI